MASSKVVLFELSPKIYFLKQRKFSQNKSFVYNFGWTQL